MNSTIQCIEDFTASLKRRQFLQNETKRHIPSCLEDHFFGVRRGVELVELRCYAAQEWGPLGFSSVLRTPQEHESLALEVCK